MRRFPSHPVDLWTSLFTGGYPRIYDRSLEPTHRNLRKRAIKTSKLHFVDSGLACWLLGIREPDQLRLHPLRGALFESWVTSEILKARLHNAKPADLFHLRQDRGSEVDLIAFGQATAEQHPHLRSDLRLIHGGVQTGRRNNVELIPWEDVQAFEW